MVARRARSAGRGDAAAGRDLRAHCLAFCTALERHHVGEDTLGFPALEHDFPELGPTLELLRRDHDMISGILSRLAALAGEPGARSGSPGRWPGSRRS